MRLVPEAHRILERLEFHYTPKHASWLGVRGKPPAPAPGTQWESVLHAPVGGHSEKPQLFLELIEGYFPTLPKIELNRRGLARTGWDAWGNEASQFNAEIAAAHLAACEGGDGATLSVRGDDQ